MLYSQVLDKDKKGYLGSEELTKFMTQEGQKPSLFTKKKMRLFG